MVADVEGVAWRGRWAECYTCQRDNFCELQPYYNRRKYVSRMAGCEYGWVKTCVADRRPWLKLGKKPVDHKRRQ